MFHRIYCALILCFCCTVVSFAQNFLPYRITVLDTASQGYYFIGIVNTLNGPNVEYPMILDAKGRMVYYCSANTGDFKVHSNGLISVFKQQKFMLMDSTFTVIDAINFKNGIGPDGHDFQILPNGHYLLVGSENVTMDLSSYHLFSHNESPGSSTANVRCGVIQEQDENQNVVFEWHSKDYFAFDDVDSSQLNSPTTVDWEHFNAVEMDTDGNLLVSIRYFNQIVKVNHSDSTVMWRLGGKQNDFTFTNDTARFIAQHDCRRIANGHLTLFDNGKQGVPVHPATAKEYAIDETTHTVTLVWSYVQHPGAFSRAMGNVQRLANGNSVICFGVMPNDSATFAVVKPSGDKIFEAAFISLPTSYRAYNFPVLPFELQRPHISCFDSAGEHYLDAGSGYASYLWSTGATTQTMAVNTADSFFVFVPAGTLGFIGSEYFMVTNPAAPCGLPSSSYEAIPDKAEVFLYPNPADDKITIRSYSFTGEPVEVELFDFSGRKVRSVVIAPTSQTFYLPVNDLESGIYWVRSGEWSKKFIKQ